MGLKKKTAQKALGLQDFQVSEVIDGRRYGCWFTKS